MKLAEGGFLFRSVGVTVHDGPAHTADALTAVMVKGYGFFAFPGQPFIEDIKHLQK
jgi:hypothetical protein